MSAASSLDRFSDPWWKTYDDPKEGFIDETGFMHRLPVRLESTEVIVYGTVDAEKMWADFPDERFEPLLVGGRAVVSIWFNNFKDTDCGGPYWETWYNTFVTEKAEGREPLNLPHESPLSMIISHPDSQGFLQRVICGDLPDNPGAAMKAIAGGRAIWGFPKHPVPAELRFAYSEDGQAMEFDGAHLGKQAVKLRMRLPEADAEGLVTIPVEAVTSPDTNVAGPRLGGTHLGMNGAHQVLHGSAMKFTQHARPWDPATDTLELGEDDHYAAPIKRWDFQPVLKAHSPDFKIAAFKPSNWISGDAAAAYMKKHEATLRRGVSGGRL